MKQPIYMFWMRASIYRKNVNRKSNLPDQFRALAILLVLTFMHPAHADEYTFAIVPQQSTLKLAKSWIPVITYLEKHSGHKLKFVTAPSIPIFEERLAAGQYDFAYMNPYHYVVAHTKPGYNAFLKVKDKKIKGIIVVHKDSPITDIQQLDEKVIAFPSPMAFAATLLPRAYAHKNSIKLYTAYVRSHDSVYRNVAFGRYEAGGGVIRTLNAINPEISDQLRILWTSDGYTPHAFAHHPRINTEVIESLSKAMLAMQNDSEGMQLLTAIQMTGFETASDSDWNDIRELNIEIEK